MVYTIKFYTDGGCRNNGRPNATAAAAAVLETKYGRTVEWVEELPSYPTPTNQRAEITGIIIALEQALRIYDTLDSNPSLDLTIHTDSKYAVNCITEWIYKWTKNGWNSAKGYEVINRDLLEKASQLDDEVAGLGSVRYVWVPREDNELADRLCNENMDEQGTRVEYSDSDSDYY